MTNETFTGPGGEWHAGAHVGSHTGFAVWPDGDYSSGWIPVAESEASDIARGLASEERFAAVDAFDCQTWDFA